jgi:hypothetical protein
MANIEAITNKDSTRIIMRICRLHPVHLANPEEFKWEWRCEHCERRSSKSFDFFYDCMEDARRKGFRVVLQKPVGESAPVRDFVLEY